MSIIPILYTPRLCLRAFTLADAPRVQELAGHVLVAKSTLNVPHPYPDGAAEMWIEGHAGSAGIGRQWNFAITLAGTRTPGHEQDVTDTGHIVGTISVNLRKAPAEKSAELGYWIGVQYWNKGFATEAAHAAINFAFGRLGYEEIVARHFASNPASGRVMQKLGMTLDATFSGVQLKDGASVDVVGYSLLREEWRVKGSWRRRAALVAGSPEEIARNVQCVP